MLKLRENKGITMLALMVTVIVLIILARVSLVIGTKVTSQIRVDSYYTDMITIKAKAKVLAEEVNAQIWNLEGEDKENKRRELYLSNYNMKAEELTEEFKQQIDPSVGENEQGFLVTKVTLEKMGLSGMDESRNYIVIYNINDYTKIDVIYKPGLEYNGSMYYSLSRLQKDLKEE